MCTQIATDGPPLEWSHYAVAGYMEVLCHSESLAYQDWVLLLVTLSVSSNVETDLFKHLTGIWSPEMFNRGVSCTPFPPYK